jgi:hypothetical protein
MLNDGWMFSTTIANVSSPSAFVMPDAWIGTVSARDGPGGPSGRLEEHAVDADADDLLVPVAEAPVEPDREPHERARRQTRDDERRRGVAETRILLGVRIVVPEEELL